MICFRFIPDEIYLNAFKLGVHELASDINDIINNSRRYLDFFKWHDYYTFHASNEDHYYDVACKLCTFLNNKTRKDERKVYENITSWWNFPLFQVEKLSESNSDDFSESLIEDAAENTI